MPPRKRQPPVKFVKQYTTLLGDTYRVYEARGERVKIRTARAFEETSSWLIGEAKAEARRLLHGGN